MRATGLLTLAAGVSLAEAVEAMTGLRADIKWPNDLLVGRRKLAGILAESAAADLGYVVLGYGLNVSARAWPPEVAHRATSIESELGRPVDRARLGVETIAAIAAALPRPPERPVRCYSRRVAQPFAVESRRARHVAHTVQDRNLV